MKIKKKKEEKPKEKKIEFVFYAPEAMQVFLAGDFNNWDTQSLPMESKDQTCPGPLRI
jgi:1,4-alpha-glucan branching enzyme